MTNSIELKHLLMRWKSNEYIYDTHEKRLERLIEWCKIVHHSLEAEQIQDAKTFLAEAIADAQKPSI
ncbi:hypothetical protein G7B40_013745 [Aetokthonos hydrillicola Thurmond2011]|uniref:Uncharacterized protein n=1 Tax=Aetokthonos hydrillicola Thurmond2011 TaxID=2712845 RepID=A0AAP5M9D2_9CYAN|nr:hypothetical protein [Aetokthonos hydrillicola]MBO3461273.1 hypothetical protein [Aetokthonos hydrillicola CCALA 1050]MBW4583682.1 hypothetical protein [Aetokthonos hydrillicola CCALA 1050]MDR9895622.1 hypothetical protein [Aetokthonos hydrillicola Thurmond2011]